METNKRCASNPEAELEKMEFLILFNTEAVKTLDSSNTPIIRNSYIKNFDFNPQKRYELQSVINRGVIDENRGLYRTESADFYQLDLNKLVESPNSSQ